MTFEEFKATCNNVASTQVPARAACPIDIGTGEARSALGDAPFHNLIIYRMVPDGEALRQIYSSVRFSFDTGPNEVVISPITTGVE